MKSGTCTRYVSPFSIQIKFLLQQRIHRTIQGKRKSKRSFNPEPIVYVKTSRTFNKQINLGPAELKLVFYTRNVVPVLLAGDFVVLGHSFNPPLADVIPDS